jgi:NAD(P)H-dependent FMN reductase
MRLLCLASSLRPGNRTSALTMRVADGMTALGHDVDRMHLSDVEMEFCDARPLAEYGASMRAAVERVTLASAYVIGMPVYCWSVPGVLKNFLDVACTGMVDKPFAVVAVAGSERGYLAAADLQRILQYEVRGRPWPRVVFASDRDFTGSNLSDDVGKRLDALAREFPAWAQAQQGGRAAGPAA